MTWQMRSSELNNATHFQFNAQRLHLCQAAFYACQKSIKYVIFIKK